MLILEEDKDKIDKLTKFGNKFFPSPDETKNEIDMLLDRTEVFEFEIDYIYGKVVLEK